MSDPITLDNFQTVFVQLLAPQVMITEERAAFFQEAFSNKPHLLYHLDFDGSAMRFANHAIAKIREIDCAGLEAILDVLSSYYGSSSPVQAQIETLRGMVTFLCEIPIASEQQPQTGTERESTGNAKLFCNDPGRKILSSRESQLNVLNDWYLEDLGNPVMVLQGGEGAGKSSLAWAWQAKLAQSEQSPSIIYWWQFNENQGIHELIGDFTRNLKAPLDQEDLLTPNRMIVPRLINHFSRLRSLLLILDDFDVLLRGAQAWSLVSQTDGVWPAWKRDTVDITSDFLLDLILHPDISIKTLIVCNQIPTALQTPAGSLRSGVRQYALNSGLGLERAREIFAEKGLNEYVEDVEALCEPVRYYPLSVRLLAGYFSHLQFPNADIFTRRDRDVLANQAKVIDLAWRYLTVSQKELLTQLALAGEPIRADELALLISYEWDETQEAHPEVMLATDVSSTEIEAELTLLAERGFLRLPDGQGRYGIHSDLKAFIVDNLPPITARKKHHILSHYYAIKLEAQPGFRARMARFHHLIKEGKCETALKFFIDEIQPTILYEDLPDVALAEIDMLSAFLPEGPAGGCLEAIDDRMRVLNNIGMLYTEIGLLRQASEYLEEYLDLLLGSDASTGYPALERWADAYPLLGNFLIPNGRFRDGLAYLAWRKANLYANMSVEEMHQDAHYYHSIELTQQGRILGYAGRFEEANVAFAAAREAFSHYQSKEARHIFPLLTLGHLCEFSYLIEKPEDGLQIIEEMEIYLDQLQTYLKKREDEEIDGRTLFARLYSLEREQIKIDWLRGWGFTKLNEFAKAHEALNRAEVEGDRVNAFDLLPVIMLAQARLKLLEVGNGAISAGNGHQIHLDLDKGMRIATRANQVPVLADLYNLRAALYMGETRLTDARQTAEKARRLAYQCDLPTKYQAYAHTVEGHFVYRAYTESEAIIQRVDGLEKML